MTVDFKLIGMRIQRERKRLGITQEKLSEQLNVSVGYVSQIERGITKPNLEMLSEISLLLNCDIGDIVSGTVRGKDEYLKDEFSEIYLSLTDKEKNIVMKLMETLIENR